MRALLPAALELLMRIVSISFGSRGALEGRGITSIIGHLDRVIKAAAAVEAAGAGPTIQRHGVLFQEPRVVVYEGA
jgi:hypothetical protein